MPKHTFHGGDNEPVLTFEPLGQNSWEAREIYIAEEDSQQAQVPSGYHPNTVRLFGRRKAIKAGIGEVKNDPMVLAFAVRRGSTREEAAISLSAMHPAILGGLEPAMFSGGRTLIALATMSLDHVVIGPEGVGEVRGDCLDVAFFTQNESLGARVVAGLVEIRTNNWLQDNQGGMPPLIYELGASRHSMARSVLGQFTTGDGKGLLFQTSTMGQVGPYYLRTNRPL